MLPPVFLHVENQGQIHVYIGKGQRVDWPPRHWKVQMCKFVCVSLEFQTVAQTTTVLSLNSRPLLMLFSLPGMCHLLPWPGYSFSRFPCLLWKAFPEHYVWVGLSYVLPECPLLTIIYPGHSMMHLPPYLFVPQVGCKFLEGNLNYRRLYLQHLVGGH